ncbi:hypothetical protein [Dyella sp. GSA-30]|uniref:hypothetical protein n=1 Tax=Dyella sp. GSA-30 TaxID=2994496 RepID=UPI0024908A5F|nr:hypothetical protein [Dyella sp. GSA-30]BDU19738.1 hypothetical protein DYGSA30_11950 [Dyella sp. GSA-30]
MKILKVVAAASLAFSLISGEAMANCVSCVAPGGPDNTTVWSLILVGCGLCGLQPDHAGTPRVGAIPFDANDPGKGLVQAGGSTSVMPVFKLQDNGTSYTITMSSAFEDSTSKQSFGLFTTETVDKQTAAVLSISEQLDVYSSADKLLGEYTTTDNNPNMYSLSPSTYQFVYSNGSIITLQQNFDPTNPLAGTQPIEPQSIYPGEYTSPNLQIKMFIPPSI